MKKLFAATVLAGLLVAGCSSSDTEYQGGTYDSGSTTWGGPRDPVITDDPSTNESWSARRNSSTTNQDVRGQTVPGETNQNPDAVGGSSTPGGHDAARDSSTGRNSNDSNTNNANGNNLDPGLR